MDWVSLLNYGLGCTDLILLFGKVVMAVSSYVAA